MPLDAPPGRLEAKSIALADEVHGLLVKAILDGRLAAGERLRDLEVAELLGISRTPVREAMQRLQRQGLVEVAAHRYTRVTAADPAMQSEAIELLGYVGGVGLRLAVPRMSVEERARTLALLDEMIAAVEQDDASRICELGANFHQSVTLTTQNRLFVSILRESAPTMQRFLASWRPFAEDKEAALASYRRLRDAIAAGDGPAAEAALRAQHGLD